MKATVSPDGDQGAIAFAEKLLALEHLPRIKEKEPTISYYIDALNWTKWNWTKYLNVGGEAGESHFVELGVLGEKLGVIA